MSLETSFRALVGKNIERMNETIAILYNFSNFCESSKRNVRNAKESYTSEFEKYMDASYAVQFLSQKK